MKTKVFTIIASNYLAKAKVLALSFKKYHPGVHFTLIQVDGKFNDNPDSKLFDEYLTLDDVIAEALPSREAWIFSHDIVELCTAIKADAFLKLFEEAHVKQVVYLDPDIQVYSKMSELFDKKENFNVLLTPHFLQATTGYENIAERELQALRYGVFNLGFLAVRKSNETRRFLDWWSERLKGFCFDDPARGLFTDQKWINLVPILFKRVKVLEHMGYNIARWNLQERELIFKGKQVVVKPGTPVRFIHFSGFDSGEFQEEVERYAVSKRVIRNLALDYAKLLRSNGHPECAKLKVGLNFYSNGIAIKPEHRKTYRESYRLKNLFRDPYSAAKGKICLLSWLKNKKLPT